MMGKSYQRKTRRSKRKMPSPPFVRSAASGANDRFTLAGIGIGGQGTGDLGACLGVKEVQVVASVTS